MSRKLQRSTQSQPQQQNGAALIMGLIMLALITLLGVTAMRTTALEERMAGQSRDSGLAFQAAEAALRQAELYLNGAVLGSFNNLMPTSTGLYQPRAAGVSGFTDPYTDDAADDKCTVIDVDCKPWWEVLRWTANDSIAYSGTIAGVAAAPRFIIENVSGRIECDKAGCTYTYVPIGGSQKFGPVADTGLYRITARGVGGQTDDAGTPITIVMLQSVYRR